MKNLFQILLISSLLLSCNSSKKLVFGDALTSYAAAGNDMASINLSLYESNAFVFEFRPFSFERKAKDKGIKEIGTYSEDLDWYTFYFSEELDWSLKDLFDQEMDGSEVYQILNPRTLKLRKDLNYFYVWGILLEKKY